MLLLQCPCSAGDLNTSGAFSRRVSTERPNGSGLSPGAGAMYHMSLTGSLATIGWPYSLQVTWGCTDMYAINSRRTLGNTYLPLRLYGSVATYMMQFKPEYRFVKGCSLLFYYTYIKEAQCRHWAPTCVIQALHAIQCI